MGLDPVKMPGMAANSIIFISSFLKPAQSCVYRGYNEKEIIEGIRETSNDRPFFTKGFSSLIPLIEKTRITSFIEKTGDYPEVKVQGEIKAETGEINWHVSDKSYVEIVAPKTESIIGYIPGTTTLLKHLKVNLLNKFAGITLVSLDNKSISDAEKLLLLTTGRTGMNGMKWSDDRRRLIENGAKPTTIEVIKGEITLSGLTGAKKIIVEPLDGGGNPVKAVSASFKKGSVKFKIGDEVTVWYYLQVKR
jgi:hypothetical protein